MFWYLIPLLLSFLAFAVAIQHPSFGWGFAWSVVSGVLMFFTIILLTHYS